MKLIDVLATELRNWPDKRATAMQSGEDEEIYFDGGSPDDFYVDTRAEDGGLSGAVVTRQEWEVAVAVRLATPTAPTLETMLAEWRDLEARAQAAQAEADALFEHVGQCHGEICVRLAELGWGAPRVTTVASEPVAEEPVLADNWWRHVKIGDMLTYQVGDGKYHCAGEFTHGRSYQVTNLDENDDSFPWGLQSCPDLELWGSPDYFTPSAQQ